MNNYFHPEKSSTANEGISLRLLVDDLLTRAEPTIFKNRISVVNEVPRDVFVLADEQKVIPLIHELLETVFINGLNTRIHVSAERFRDIIILRIQDRNNNNGYALSFTVMGFEPQAAEAGGSIQIEGKQQKVATISFSFPNHAYTA